jgi:hypothetical protein
MIETEFFGASGQALKRKRFAKVSYEHSKNIPGLLDPSKRRRIAEGFVMHGMGGGEE